MKRTLTAALAAIVAALALAPHAEAAKLKPAKFELEAEGEQLTTWTYDKTVGPCDYPDNEDGRQYIQFDSPGNTAPTVRAVRARTAGSVLHYLDDEEGLVMYSRADALRNYEVLYSQMTPCGGDDPYGGEPTPDAIGTSTCKLDGQIEGSAAPASSPTSPACTTRARSSGWTIPKASIYFSGDGYWGGGSADSLPSACSTQVEPNADLGLQDTEGEWPGNIVPVAGSLPAKKLLTAKKFSVDLGRTINYPNDVQTYVGGPVTTGKTRVDVTLTLKRIGR